MNGLIINKKQLVKFISFLVVFIYIGFLCLDATTMDLGTDITLDLKYLVILLCFIISILIGKEGHNKIDTYLVIIARLFTLIADYYLVIQDHFKFGVLFFCLVQITYIIRHTLMEEKKYKNIIFLCVISIFAIIISKRVNLSTLDKELVILAFVYATLLTSSLYSAIRTIKSGKYSKNATLLIAIGMTLFFMCDINVALFNLIGNVQFTSEYWHKVEFYMGFLIWLFYAPSQLLLALSGFREGCITLKY